MKTRMTQAGLAILFGTLSCLPLRAQTTVSTNLVPPSTGIIAPESTTPTTILAPTSAPNVSAKLPYGAEDVLKLSQAQVSEEVILNYIHNSGTIYNLNPQDIVYLRDEGVSDRVVNAMLDQRKVVGDQAAQSVAQPAAPAAAPAAPVPAAPEGNAVDTAPAPTYVTPPAADVSAGAPSTLYVIPYPAARAAYYGYYQPYGYGYGYYPYYSGYCGPTVSFGFRFGGGYHGGYYHGGYRAYGGAHYGGRSGGGHYGGGRYGGHR